MFNIRQLVLPILLVCAAIPARAEDSDLKRIVDAGAVRLGAVDAPPYYIHDLATGKWSGQIPELTEAIFGTVGIKVEYVQTEWGTAVAGLQAGRFDIMGGYNATPARALAIDFTVPVGITPTGIVTFAEDPTAYDTWEKLNKPEVRIGAVEGAGSTRTAQATAPNATWVLVPTTDGTFLELESRRVDVVLTTTPTLSDYVAARQKGTIVVPQPVLGNPSNYGLPKSASKELRDWMDVAITAGKLDQSLTRIWEKYVPPVE